MEVRRKNSQMFDIGSSDEENYDFDVSGENGAHSDKYSDSGVRSVSPTLLPAIDSSSSLRKNRNESTFSLCSNVSGVRARHSSGQSIIARETSIHLDDDEDLLHTTVVNSRGWQGIKDSVYFMKAGMEAIIEDEVTSRFEAEQLASWNMLTRTSISFYQFVK